eukprot:scaffold209945_cov31-Prasinocladus_malaysianus.AAC.2
MNGRLVAINEENNSWNSSVNMTTRLQHGKAQAADENKLQLDGWFDGLAGVSAGLSSRCEMTLRPVGRPTRFLARKMDPGGLSNKTRRPC